MSIQEHIVALFARKKPSRLQLAVQRPATAVTQVPSRDNAGKTQVTGPSIMLRNREAAVRRAAHLRRRVATPAIRLRRR